LRTYYAAHRAAATEERLSPFLPFRTLHQLPRALPPVTPERLELFSLHFVAGNEEMLNLVEQLRV
jgi:hypothetical protein